MDRAMSEEKIAGADIVVIVVTYNSQAMFARQAAALRAQTTQGFRLVVWDNASAPDQRPLAADFPEGADIVLSPDNLGFAAGNNRAAERAPEARFIVLLNPDAFPEPTWLEELLRAAAAHPEAACFGSTQIDGADPAVFDGLGDAYHALGVGWRGGHGQQGHAPVSGETFSACAAAMLVRGDAWRAAGGFDERFFSYGEDLDLGFRLRLMGHAVRQVAPARVAHMGGASAPRRSDFAVYYGRRNRLWLFVKNMPAPVFWLMAPAHAFFTAALWLNALARNDTATLRALADALRGLPEIWRRRRAVQAVRTASVFAIVQALAWSPWAPLSRCPIIWNRPPPGSRAHVQGAR
jgi:N-acetylglucosaminyl-diphospho-decaprenol L-rhamnosyltransferase